MSNKSEVMGRALRLLSRRAHGEGELRRKLLRSGYTACEIDGAIERLVELGYLDDEAVAARGVEQVLSRRRGLLAARARLLRHGFASSLADRICSTERFRELEVDACLRAAARIDSPDRARLVSRLSARGFRREAIAKVLENHGH